MSSILSVENTLKISIKGEENTHEVQPLKLFSDSPLPFCRGT
jgi:hypothetical protein